MDEDVYGQDRHDAGHVGLVGYFRTGKTYGHGNPYRGEEGYDIRKEENDGKHVASHVNNSLIQNFCRNIVRNCATVVAGFNAIQSAFILAVVVKHFLNE